MFTEEEDSVEQEMIKIPESELNQVEVPEFQTALKFSLWTDLCGEQTEFMDALEYIGGF